MFDSSASRAFRNDLSATNFVDQIVLFGATLLGSVLPLIIIGSALVNNHVDDDIASALGANAQGSHVLARLFRQSAQSFDFGVLLAFVIGLAGTIAAARTVQGMYEGVFKLPHLPNRLNFVRLFAWVVVVALAVAGMAAFNRPVDAGIAGKALGAALDFVVLFLIFAWSIHFLLGGRLRWRSIRCAAVATAAFWVGLGVFSSFYFSGSIVSDSHLYGAVGVIFSLMTWFIAIGAVILLGAIVGEVWVREVRPKSDDPETANHPPPENESAVATSA